ncbi:hypothetical protein E2C01_091457 [Portunus trituberculatus]|uniref:Uncharacterized protein n=1 Tax=Portunus trituberculatus TaxID=210409 RepID=A0A5B7JP44_PORTR|nr:hypothetical protein [Portunus trituberculatus]
MSSSHSSLKGLVLSEGVEASQLSIFPASVTSGVNSNSLIVTFPS